MNVIYTCKAYVNCALLLALVVGQLNARAHISEGLGSTPTEAGWGGHKLL